MLTNVWQQSREANLLLTASKPPLNTQSAAVQWLAANFESRWFGTPALFRAPAIDNTDFRFFDVSGHTQAELIRSLNAADICKTYGPCQQDPANPSGIAWGLEGGVPGGSYQCYSPRTTTLHYRFYVLMPRWSPLAMGGVSVSLVERWNALQRLIYIHEAGHVAIDTEGLAHWRAQEPARDAAVHRSRDGIQAAGEDEDDHKSITALDRWMRVWHPDERRIRLSDAG